MIQQKTELMLTLWDKKTQTNHNLKYFYNKTSPFQSVTSLHYWSLVITFVQVCEWSGSLSCYVVSFSIALTLPAAELQIKLESL